MADFMSAARKTLDLEGGYQNMPQDRGNYACGRLVGTNLGISAQVLQEYLGRCPIPKDSMELTKDEALDIYRTNYWEAIDGDSFKNQSVAEIVFDTAILQGVGAAKRIARDAMGDLAANGSTYSVEEINRLNQRAFFEKFRDNREKYIMNIGGYYLEGWMNRLRQFDFRTDWEKNLILAVLFSASIVYLSSKLLR